MTIEFKFRPEISPRPLLNAQRLVTFTPSECWLRTVHSGHPYLRAHHSLYFIKEMTLLYLRWVTTKNLLYNTWNYTQRHVAAWMVGSLGGEWIDVYV